MNSKYYKNVLKKRIGYLVLLVCVIAIGAILASYLTNNPILSYVLQHMYQPADSCYALFGLPYLIKLHLESISERLH